MNIKNYTSSTPVVNSINKIEHRLTSAGATHIAKMYEQERPVGMIFQISINNILMTFKLPAKQIQFLIHGMKCLTVLQGDT